MKYTTPIHLDQFVDVNETASLHIINKESIVFREMDQQFFSLDHLATFIWCCCREKLTLLQIKNLLAQRYILSSIDAETCIIDTVLQWRGLGLLSDYGKSIPTHRSEYFFEQIDSLNTGSRPISTDTINICKYYKLVDTTFCVRYTSKEQEQYIHPVFEHIQILCANSADISIEIFYDNDEFILRYNLVEFARCETLQQLAPQIKRFFLDSAINNSSASLAFHAGVVATNRGCLMLPGRSGSGKTTLTAGLLRLGLDYLSDELALLDERFHVCGVPISLCVKEGAWDLLGTQFPNFLDLPIHYRLFDNKQVRYLPPPISRLVFNKMPVRWVVFPRYEAALKTQLVALDKDTGIRKLFKERITTRRQLDKYNVHNLIHLIQDVDFFEISVSSLEEAIPLLQELIENKPA